MSKLSEAIRQIRKDLGTQTEAARNLGIKQSTLSQYETGLVKPSFGVLMRIYNLAPPGPDRQFIHEYLTSRMNNRPDLVEDIAAGFNFINETTPAGTPHRTQDLEQFAALVVMIRNRGPKLDKSVNDILELWILYGNNRHAVRGFRDAAKYLKMYVDLNVEGRAPAVAARGGQPLKTRGKKKA